MSHGFKLFLSNNQNMPRKKVLIPEQVVVCGRDLTRALFEVCSYKRVPFSKVVDRIKALQPRERALFEKQLELLAEIVGKGKVWEYTTAHLIVKCIKQNIPLIHIGLLMRNAPVVGDARGGRFHFIITEKDWTKIRCWREQAGLAEDAFLQIAARHTGKSVEELRKYLDGFFAWFKQYLSHLTGAAAFQAYQAVHNPLFGNVYLASLFVRYLELRGVR